MSRFASTPVGVFLFLTIRSARNALVRFVRRLKQPRYGVAFLVGAMYFYWLFVRPDRGRRGSSRLGTWFDPEMTSLVLWGAALALAFLFIFTWLLRRGKPALSLTEAEVQFLFPAPLPARSVLHYALLRPQLGLLFSAAIFAIVFKPAPLPERLLTLVSTWLVLSILQFHALGMAFTKAAWQEQPPGRRRAIYAAGLAGLLGLAAILALWLADAWGRLAELLENGRPGVREIEEALFGSTIGTVAGLLLWPFRAALAPSLARDPGSLAASLPPSLLLLALHYFWVMRTTVRFEEATLEHAARRAQRRANWRRGRTREAPGISSRHIVPFPLPPRGMPELAIVWKNLLAWQRFRIVGWARWAALVTVALFFLSRFLLAPGRQALGIGIVMALAGVTVGFVFLLPLAMTYDFRRDLEHADSLKVWPLPPARLAAAELAAPWVLSVLYLWTGLAASLAVLWGTLSRGGSDAPAKYLDMVPFALPGAISLAVFLPALAALALVVQNAAVLAFPGWFRPRERKAMGLETTGIGILTMVVTMLALLLAAIPAAIVAVILVFVFRGALGFWSAPFVAVGASLPLWAEAALGVGLLGRLFERLDPSRDLAD